MKKIKVRVKSKIIPLSDLKEICRDAERVDFITGVDRYDGKNMYFDLSCVHKDGKRYIVARDCGKLVFGKEF